MKRITMKLTPLEALLVRRRRTGATRADDARSLGITLRALRSYEEGTRTPPPGVLKLIEQQATQKGNA